jgi:hypothetical protein
MLGNLLGGFIVILIGVQLLPIVAQQVQLAKDNISSTTVDNLLDLITIFYTLGIVTSAISLTVSGLRQSGLI